MEKLNTDTYREIAQLQESELMTEVQEIVDAELQNFTDLLTDDTRVMFTGAGSSAYIGEVLEELHTEFETHAIPTTDIVMDPEKYLVKNYPIIMFSFARSGNSPESKAVVNLAQQLNPNIKHVVVTNNKDGFLASEFDADVKIVLPDRTNDRSLAMTSSYTTMLLAAARLIGHSLSTQFIDKLPQYFTQLETFTDTILNVDFKKVFYVGTGIYHAVAYETALKMNELTMGEINVYHESTLGFRHGPKAALTEGALYIQLLSNNAYQNQYEVDLYHEMNASDQYFKVMLCPESYQPTHDILEDYEVFTVEEPVSKLELAMIYVWFGQLLACKKSLLMGRDPDNPSADGFINRVVKGVTLYDY